MAPKRFRFSDGPPTVHWDGQALHGDAAAKVVAVSLPARLVSFRHEEFPPAEETALKAAARMRAERAFAPLGAVAIEARFEPLRDGRCAALLLAVPRTTLEAVRKAALAQGRSVAAVRVAELLVPVPIGGLVEVAGEACLLAIDGERVRAVAALGPVAASGFAQRLARERLSLGVAEDAPAAPPMGAELDFLHPTLSAPLPMLKRRGVRLALLGAGVAAAAVLATAMMVSDALTARDDARAEADSLRPLAKTLADKRADMKELAGWFESRPALMPALHALSASLPTSESEGQVHLVRVRQSLGEESVAEGVAADKAQMMAFLTRLRKDPRVGFAEIRAFRSPSKGSNEVVFELGFRLGAPPSATPPPAVPAASKAPAASKQGAADAGA